jgi:hypothetical protein
VLPYSLSIAVKQKPGKPRQSAPSITAQTAITYGRGTIKNKNPANSPNAPVGVSLLNIGSANSGKPPAKQLRRNVFPAMAEAAYRRYATTRYVNAAVKTKIIPVPNGIEAMIGATQWTCEYEVNARHKTDIGVSTAPAHPMINLISGGGFPSCFSY